MTNVVTLPHAARHAAYHVARHAAHPVASALAADSRVAGAPMPAWRAVLVAAVLSAAGAALFAATAADTAAAIQQAGTELTTLLRFMAIVKAVMALALVAVVGWRLGHPAGTGAAVAYVVAAASATAAPILIWQMAHVALGAAAFHAAVLVLVGAGFADRDGRRFVPVKRAWPRDMPAADAAIPGGHGPDAA